ncbi:MAG: hypothetical protein C0405_13985, partial [Desulfovibrio sp.]|nr:hypothetical protein [Desulfovibrio sp.]
ALLWWGVQSVYIYFQIGVARYNAIYGGFASLPLFFIWVQVSWMVLLFGNELARAAHVCVKGPLPRALEPKLQGARREWLGLRLLVLVGRRFIQGGPAYSPAELARELAAPERQVVALASDLARAGVISLLNTCGVVQPARALEAVSLAQALAALRGEHSSGDEPPSPDPALDQLWQRLEQNRHQSLEGMTLADLIKE